ncbi:MAG: 50S ribosomal protein L15 [Armatimonadota bacterium]|nr:50S ribosomal protein L15 [Armatimonadota bacterium]MDR7401387.1 50S ribosomal protein L15 [Armatimonadota bacterium]MDR7404716.1 50S ribosomal protein L15 [Armatimonadota bacterium]MDR7437939.1 50S ribosomal protein L15 [Armatimonadota bacterium]MDR7473347.1 50S ribosomal protein L15 [Armatimonadota bacterium]
MLSIDTLKPPRGARRKRRRVGRGLGSGRGVYSGRGRKGQKARAGAGPRPGFEGGQTILVKRLPFRRGVRAGGASHTGGVPSPGYEPVNLDALARFPAGSEVTPQTLREAGLVRRGPVKILGRGSLDRPLVVRAHAFSRRAAEAIRQAGGRAEVIADAGRSG